MYNGGSDFLHISSQWASFLIVVAMLLLCSVSIDGVNSGDLPRSFYSIVPIENYVDTPEHSLDISSNYDLGKCSKKAYIFSCFKYGIRKGLICGSSR